jgi:GAF domain-containing protein
MLSGLKNLFRPPAKGVEQTKVEGSNFTFENSPVDIDQRVSALLQDNKTLKTVNSISRISAQVENEKGFLEQSVEYLLEENKYEHVTVYVLDQVEENMILQASHSKKGDVTDSFERRLKVVRSASPNLATEFGTLHIIIGEWNYYINIPKQLPGLIANLALPILHKDRLYGLLNIQISSSDPLSLDKQSLQSIADQMAQSIANLRLIHQLKERAHETDEATGGKYQSGWEQLAGGGTVGFSYDRLQLLPADETFSKEVTDQLLAGKSVTISTTQTHPQSRLVAPITLRETTIGVIGYESESIDHVWRDDERALLETVASRVSLALENTRLVAEAQQRADRERLISQVTTRMRETLDIETILKTAVMEIRQSLGLSEAEVRLQLAEGSKPSEVSHEQ